MIRWRLLAVSSDELTAAAIVKRRLRMLAAVGVRSASRVLVIGNVTAIGTLRNGVGTVIATTRAVLPVWVIDPSFSIVTLSSVTDPETGINTAVFGNASVVVVGLLKDGTTATLTHRNTRQALGATVLTRDIVISTDAAQPFAGRSVIVGRRQVFAYASATGPDGSYSDTAGGLAVFSGQAIAAQSTQPAVRMLPRLANGGQAIYRSWVEQGGTQVRADLSIGGAVIATASAAGGSAMTESQFIGAALSPGAGWTYSGVFAFEMLADSVVLCALYADAAAGTSGRIGRMVVRRYDFAGAPVSSSALDIEHEGIPFTPDGEYSPSRGRNYDGQTHFHLGFPSKQAGALVFLSFSAGTSGAPAASAVAFPAGAVMLGSDRYTRSAEDIVGRFAAGGSVLPYFEEDQTAFPTIAYTLGLMGGATVVLSSGDPLFFPDDGGLFPQRTLAAVEDGATAYALKTYGSSGAVTHMAVLSSGGTLSQVPCSDRDANFDTKTFERSPGVLICRVFAGYYLQLSGGVASLVADHVGASLPDVWCPSSLGLFTLTEAGLHLNGALLFAAPSAVAAALAVSGSALLQQVAATDANNFELQLGSTTAPGNGVWRILRADGAWTESQIATFAIDGSLTGPDSMPAEDIDRRFTGGALSLNWRGWL